MIIKGLVLTNEGSKDISEIKPGDYVINRTHKPILVTKVEKAESDSNLSFTKNTGIIAANGTPVMTIAGSKPLENGAEHIIVTLDRPIKDTAIKYNGSRTAYKIYTASMNTLVCNNYCFTTEEFNG